MITTKKIVELLNQTFKRDKAAIYALCSNRVPWHGVNDDDLNIVVDVEQKDFQSLGMLGILNGIADMEDKRIGMSFTKEKIPQFVGFILLDRSAVDVKKA